jgi:hypothetical protein
MGATLPKKSKANSGKETKVPKRRRGRESSKSKNAQSLTKSSNKLKTLSVSMRAIKKSVSDLKVAVKEIQSNQGPTISELIGIVREALNSDLQDLQKENELRKDEIKTCMTNIGRIIADRNSTEHHERHSGARSSPSGRISDEGIQWGALPGSFESNKR